MKPLRFAIISIFFIVLAFVLANHSEFFSNKSRYALNLEKVLIQKCKKIDQLFNDLKTSTEQEDFKIIENADKDGVILLRYVDDSLVFWSSNAVPIYEYYPNKVFESHLVRFFNSYYYVKKLFEGSSKYIGLVEIRSKYPYDNNFLHSGINEEFGLPDNAKIRFQKGIGFEVYGDDGAFLFNIIIPQEHLVVNSRSALASVFLFIGLIAFGIFLFAFLKNIRGQRKQFIVTLTVIGSIALVRILQMVFSLSFNGFVLFDPFIYADSLLVPSLGDLFLNSIIVLFFALLITCFMQYPGMEGNTKLKSNIHLVFLNLLVMAFFLYANYFFHSLILNSDISFEPNETDQITIANFVGFLVNGLNYLSFGLVLIWHIKNIVNRIKPGRIIQVAILVCGFLFLLLFISGYPVDLISVLSYILFTILITWFYHKKYNLTNYSFLEVLILLFSFYSLGFIVVDSNKKEKSIRSSLAMSLANEHDPIAEYLFDDLNKQIVKDTSIVNRINSHMIDINNLYDYLKKNYFTGYWNKYDIQITLCGPKDSVLIEVPEFQWFYCYGFFNDIIDHQGISLPGSNFYFIENYTGRISYIGKIPFRLSQSSDDITLFIELNSRLTNDLIGYPELLLDEKLHMKRLIDQYSYAKYHNGNLVAQDGDFSYSLSSELFGYGVKGIETVKLDGYEHLLYRPDKDNLIVLSKPLISFINLLVSFSYLFLFYYLCLVVVYTVRKINKPDVSLFGNYRIKIQFSIIAILIVSLLLIAGSTIWLNLRNYKQNQYAVLNEKIQSVLAELSHRLTYEEKLTSYWRGDKFDNLNQLLIKLSDVFYTDINLYDPKGDLLATSRVEVFQMGLQGEKMNPVAFHKMFNEKRSQFLQGEKISKLSYMSAYVPFVNAEGKLLAYLNLPYFTKQSELQTALSALIVTIVNIYLILILITISVTILITDQITRPLEMLQIRFRELKLGGRYEQISYSRRDEIGNLVAEYNKMVLELEKSVDLLARSERESAWREMAKQIAHEIKNPLTPMRLSVQQLQRSWKDKNEDYDKYLERVTNTMIEQIDALSAIASEFSNFAKMPVAQIEKVNLLSVLKNTVELFDGDANCRIFLQSNLEKAEINADREQLSRVFLNIIKNGIQSVPDGQSGRIIITTEMINEEVEVRITDNGRGIPDDIISKLFIPNFTTKSSGMGLGLAIAKNILDQIGATISFKTRLGSGTTFTLCFPLNKQVVKNEDKGITPS
jgi:two-component system, NtrC family, nitrogen regulation sensor histidine kinase NtrY